MSKIQTTPLTKTRFNGGWAPRLAENIEAGKSAVNEHSDDGSRGPVWKADTVRTRNEIMRHMRLIQ